MTTELINPLVFVVVAGLMWGFTVYFFLEKKSTSDVALAFGVATIITLWYFLILLTNICNN